MARPKKENIGLLKKVGVRPLMGYVLVDPTEAESRTASGIILPDSAKEKPAEGIVLSTGEPIFINGKELPPPVKVGEKVFYKKWGTEDIKVNGKELKVVKFEDLIAVIEE